MAQHKAPTAVSIAPTTDKSGFALLVERYWKPVALVIALCVAIILFRVFQSDQAHQTRVQGWDSLLAVTAPETTGGLAGTPNEIRAVAERIKDTDAGPWGLFIAARSAVEKKQYDFAIETLAQLKAQYPGHHLLTETLPLGKDGAAMTPAQALEDRANALKTWSTAHPTLFSNPDPPTDAPKVRLNTDKGSIVIQLYPNLAPKHVENFLKLAREGYYTGIKFHRVRRGSLIQTGDPNTKEADTTTWGQGGPGYGIDSEPNDLRHFAGAVSMWKKPGDPQSSGSQFMIITGATHAMDGQNVVFGRVVEGMETATQIENAPVAAGTERPETDLSTIQSVEVL